MRAFYYPRPYGLLLQDDPRHTRPRHEEQRLAILHLRHIPKQQLPHGPTVIGELEYPLPICSSIVGAIVLVHGQDEDLVLPSVVGVGDRPAGDVVPVDTGVREIGEDLLTAVVGVD